jgi:hypothetical protein
MRALPMVLPMAMAMITACNGEKDGTVDPTDSGLPPGPVSFDLRTSTTATSFEAGVVDAALRAHKASSMLLASAALVVADEKVQDRLNTDGGGSYLRGAPLQCWERPAYPMFSFVLNYTTALCESNGISGGVFVNDHPSGPLLFEFNNLAIEDGSDPREIGGVLALDTRDAFPEPLYWQAYDTDSTNPGVDNRIPLGVEIERTLHGISYTGGASIDFLGQTWSMWGVATVTVDNEQLTVVHGARTPEEVAPDEPTGADVLKTPLNWLECRCPTSGVQALDMPLQFTSVTIDIDDLEVEPDAIDDPEVTVPVDHQLFGQGVLEHTGCGTYDVDYQTEAVELPVPTEQLVGAISFLCATATIPEQRCSALVAAAANLEGDLRVEITREQATSVALQAVENDFDTTWCQVY